MAYQHVTPARLREVLHYDPATGIFTWRYSRKGRPGKAGAVAGSVCDRGYRYICIDRIKYLAHRLAWLYVHGEWPACEIDHRDGVRGANWIGNLRPATSTMNKQNQRRARVDNLSGGMLGVSIQRDNGDVRYRARIMVQGKEIGLGRFDSPEAAHAAYVEAKRRLHEGCTL